MPNIILEKKNLLPLSGLSLVRSLWRKARKRSLSSALPLYSFILISHLFPKASLALGSLEACYKCGFLEFIRPTESGLLGIVWSGFERIYNLNKFSRWHFPHNKVWEQLQVCPFIVSPWSLFLTSGSQTWLHVRTTWEALKKRLMPEPCPQWSWNSWSGIELATSVFSKWFSFEARVKSHGNAS